MSLVLNLGVYASEDIMTMWTETRMALFIHQNAVELRYLLWGKWFIYPIQQQQIWG